MKDPFKVTPIVMNIVKGMYKCLITTIYSSHFISSIFVRIFNSRTKHPYMCFFAVYVLLLFVVPSQLMQSSFLCLCKKSLEKKCDIIVSRFSWTLTQEVIFVREV
jgi:hypothetical protein